MDACEHVHKIKRARDHVVHEHMYAAGANLCPLTHTFLSFSSISILSLAGSVSESVLICIPYFLQTQLSSCLLQLHQIPKASQ